MFRFTIRDVLWLTVVVGLGLGWWMDRQSLSNRLRHAETVIGGFKLLDDRFPAWQAEFARWLDEQRLQEAEK